MAGNSLRVNSSYRIPAFFYVLILGNDGMDTDAMAFSVTVTAEGGDNLPPSECERNITLHDGEYSGPDTINAFTAEGRVGDSATGPGNRTFELDVSKSTSGPFKEGETTNYIWDNGHPTPFVLSYDADSGVVEFSVFEEVPCDDQETEPGDGTNPDEGTNPGDGDNGKGKKKVTICHIPPGNPENAHTIKVGESAVDAHLAHGDTLGECPEDEFHKIVHEVPGEMCKEKVTVAHQTDITDKLTDILLRARARKEHARMDLDSLVLNGEVIEETLSASGMEGGVNVMQISGIDVEKGFVLEGLATMNWVETYKTNLIINGSFEEPELKHNKRWEILYADQIPGWEVQWLNGENACPAGSPADAPMLEIQRGAVDNAFHGEQYAELDTDCNGHESGVPGAEMATVEISQYVETIPGAVYEFNFVAKRRTSNNKDQLLTAYWGDEVILDAEPVNDEWTEYSFTVTAEHSVTRVAFLDDGYADSYGVFLDDIELLATVEYDLPSNSGLAFQVSVVNIEEHEFCEGPGEGDDDDKLIICHVNPEDPTDYHTMRIDRSMLHEHLRNGDFLGPCPGENDIGICEAEKSVSSPTYTLWNSFLDMVNILELVNPSKEDVSVKLSFYSILGELVHERTITVRATNQFDVIVNDLPGFVKNSYGIIRLEFEGTLDGRMMYYRTNAGTGPGGYDFVFGYPLADAMSGRTAVSFNTHQPSFKEDERENVVANWLNIVNLDSAPQEFRIETYNQQGEMIMRRVVEVPAFGRVDMDGGHDLAGPSVVGTHIIIPENIRAKYIAQLTRFGGNAPAGFAPSEYKFAFPLVASYPMSDSIFTSISNTYGEFNWLEIVNTRGEAVHVAINMLNEDGQLLESVDAVLPPYAQQHFDAASFLAPGQTGYAEVIPSTPRSVVAQSMVYFRDPQNGSITAMYGSQARRPGKCAQTGSYNLFLDMENYIPVVNTSHDPVNVTLVLNGPEHTAERVITLAPRSFERLALHDPELLNTSPNTYGQVKIYGNDQVHIFSQILRLRFRDDGLIDFAVPTPVR